jgi:hypothetical protein
MSFREQNGGATGLRQTRDGLNMKNNNIILTLAVGGFLGYISRRFPHRGRTEGSGGRNSIGPLIGQRGALAVASYVRADLKS